MNHPRNFRAALSVCVALVASVVMFATAWADPPGRVGRLAEYAGDVQMSNGQDGWQPIQRNYPITAGDNLWVSEGGRAEIDVGPLQVWLSGGANIYFERFDDQTLVARLGSGAIAVRIREWESKDSMRVMTDHGEVSFVQPGLYFVTAGNGFNPSVVSVRSGQAELNTFGRVQWVNRGDAIAFDGGGARFDRYASSYTSGGFEAWVVARDRRVDRWEARNRGYVNPWMVGVRDLDDHGYWESSYEYGRVWYPSAVSAGWAPYRYGRWSYVQPWGWTWVDDAPWGFAPFHYGRWVRLGGRWAWCPGEYVGRPIYAPALVTFFGGNGWSVSASVGPTYSWVPLGWNEPYVPWYTYTPNYWRHVNRPYVRNVAEDPWRPPAYVHASIPGAVTAVAAATFIGGRHIAQNQIRNVREIDVRSAPPARMGEVIPQFRGAAPAVVRGVDPNPVVANSGMVRGQAAPQVVIGSNRPPVAPLVKERAPMQIAPNTNIIQPRVWQDPNPVVSRQGNPREVAQPQVIQPRQSAPGVIIDNSNSRGDRITPTPKDRRERVPVYEQRGDAGAVNPPVTQFAPGAPAAPVASTATAPTATSTNVNPAAAAAVGAAAVGGAAIVATQRTRAAPVVVAPATVPAPAAPVAVGNTGNTGNAAPSNVAANNRPNVAVVAPVERAERAKGRTVVNSAENPERAAIAQNAALQKQNEIAARQAQQQKVAAERAQQRQIRAREERPRDADEKRMKIKEKPAREG
jgi:hypothetical protein